MTNYNEGWSFPKTSPRNVLFDDEFIGRSGGIGRDSENLLILLRSQHAIVTVNPSKIPLIGSRMSRQVRALFLIFFGKFRKIRIPNSSIYFQSQVSSVSALLGIQSFWVIRLHDIFPITNPEWFGTLRSKAFTKALIKAYETGAFFLVNSLATARNLLELFPDAANRVKILPCAVKPLKKEYCNKCSACCSGVGNIQSFFLCIGTVEPRKNYKWLVNTWASDSRIQDFGHDLIIVGRKGWKAKSSIKEIRKREKYGIYWISDACDGILNVLYTRATAFISVSKSEGFDMPAMEARNLYSLPLILSDIEVHREYHQNASLLFNTRETFIQAIQEYRLRPAPYEYSPEMHMF